MSYRKSTSYIVIHCTANQANPNLSVRDIRAFHIKERGWSDCGYHFVIPTSGVIQRGRPEAFVGAHALGYNDKSIGISYIGGLVKDKNGKLVNADTRTSQQRFSLFKLCHELMEKYNIPIEHVIGHYEVCSGKSCPNFDMNIFRKELQMFIDKRKQ